MGEARSGGGGAFACSRFPNLGVPLFVAALDGPAGIPAASLAELALFYSLDYLLFLPVLNRCNTSVLDWRILTFLTSSKLGPSLPAANSDICRW
jgi:hypothetical protein